jgi:predicted NBD/HSP70 family sugar kinase
LHQGPLSRADLAKVTGLSKQTTSEVIDGFERQGIVRPSGRTSGNVGRTAVLYEISPEAGYVLGVDLGGTKVRAAIGDISARVLAEATELSHPGGGLAVLEQIAAVAHGLARHVKTNLSLIRSIVVGVPGIVNPRSASVELAPNVAGLEQINVISVLSASLGAPVVIENDVNLALLGEIWHGCAQNAANVAFIALGTGIGMGLAVNGVLVRGENGGAGEIAGLPLGGDPSRPEVRHQGCLEYEAGAAGILRRYLAAGGGAVDGVRSIFERAEQGEETATRIVVDTARLVAQAATSVVAVVEPRLIVLGGSVGTRPEFASLIAEEFARISLRPNRLEGS